MKSRRVRLHCTLHGKKRSGGQWFHETGSNVLKPGDICCGFLWPFHPYIVRTMFPEERFYPRAIRTGDGNVATIVQLASRRGIISAHCHRLIEFGTDRIAHVDRSSECIGEARCNVAVNRRVQGFRSYRWLRRQWAFVKGHLVSNVYAVNVSILIEQRIAHYFL